MMEHLRSTSSNLTALTFIDVGSTGHHRLRRFLTTLVLLVAQRKSYDLVHMNVSSRGSCYRKAIFAHVLRLVGKSYILHLHGSEFREFYAASHSLIKILCRSMFRNAQRVLVLGRAWERFAVDELTCSADKVCVLPNAVPGPAAVPIRSKNETKILFTGRIGRRKGIPELLEAIRSMPHDLPPIQLLLAGDVVDDDLRELLHDVPSNVEVLGWLSQEELGKVLSDCSIFVLPSYAEGLPLSLLDAMAWGLAPVVSDVGSIGDVVTNRKNCLLIKPGDSACVREALWELIHDPALLGALGAAARVSWENGYSIGTYRERLDGIYLDSVKG